MILKTSYNNFLSPFSLKKSYKNLSIYFLIKKKLIFLLIKGEKNNNLQNRILYFLFYTVAEANRSSIARNARNLLF